MVGKMHFNMLFREIIILRARNSLQNEHVSMKANSKKMESSFRKFFITVKELFSLMTLFDSEA